ncbi:Glycosyltransferase involved in cell wall bisynthesis [Chryseolinea serpens]|uniref:Glycosyltransferase involved in cell wall bisynthesis n=1 Tax=Chryseolinea serpens TaxID=947013 RepID=A0A1M5KXU8_9BACT|nr:glycosyltransferase family 4 protein [Chryseolinea serpens]SHG57535.1 Glycosyltransferase involved in cell wall bisynthesis [Chryseolinea serpens]
MKKVLFVIDTLEMGGAEKSILEIASRFKNYTPVVCHIYPGDALKGAYLQQGIEVIGLDVPGHYNFGEAARRLQSTILSVQPAIVHSTLFRSDIVARRLRKKNGLPLINSLVNNTYHSSRFKTASMLMKMKLRVLQVLDAFTARKADLFFSNSEAIRQSNARSLVIPLDKIKVIYRGRDIEDFSNVPPEAVATLRNVWGPHRRILLNVSRLLERKGQMDLILAFKQVHNQFPDVTLLIAGEGPFRKVLEAKIRAAGLTDSVQLLGTRNDVPALLKLAKAFVFPSHYEGLPGALIEAMMSHTPIVASGIPENLECVQEGEAFIFRPGDVNDLAKSILAALGVHGAAAQRAENAYAVARQKFDITSIAAQYEAAYDNLLQR